MGNMYLTCSQINFFLKTWSDPKNYILLFHIWNIPTKMKVLYVFWWKLFNRIVLTLVYVIIMIIIQSHIRSLFIVGSLSAVCKNYLLQNHSTQMTLQLAWERLTHATETWKSYSCAVCIKICKFTWLMKAQEFVIYWHIESDMHIFFTNKINKLIGWKKKNVVWS